MFKSKKYYEVFAVIVAIVFGAWIWLNLNPQTKENNPTPKKLISHVFYKCNDNKTIDSSYFEGAPAPKPQPGQPPVPTGSVSLILSDGRQMTLPQTISGSGIRYAANDESFIFFSKGNGALALENNQQTFTGCIEVLPDPGQLPQSYENGTQGFSIRYPSDYLINENYQYSDLGPDNFISGVSFTISPSLAEGTNLGSDSYISIEQIPQTQECSPNLFLGPQGDRELPLTSITEGDTTYSVASSTGAGAGNRYEETVYAIPGTNPCIAVRYFIHYGVFENYPSGAVKMFDKQAIISQFDAIRRTLVIGQ